MPVSLRSSWKDGAIVIAAFGCFLAGLSALLAVTVFAELIWWSDSAVEASQRSGDQIVEAIEGYREDTGRYPARLEDLVPDYLEKVQRPRAGDRRWRYEVVDDGEAFVLAFALNSDNYPISWFDSRWNRRVWGHDA